jgi:hypothetical protein
MTDIQTKMGPQGVLCLLYSIQNTQYCTFRINCTRISVHYGNEDYKWPSIYFLHMVVSLSLTYIFMHAHTHTNIFNRKIYVKVIK